MKTFAGSQKQLNRLVSLIDKLEELIREINEVVGKMETDPEGGNG